MEREFTQLSFWPRSKALVRCLTGPEKRSVWSGAPAGDVNGSNLLPTTSESVRCERTKIPLYLLASCSCWSVNSGLHVPVSGRSAPWATSAVSAALVAGQWQHRSWSFLLHLVPGTRLDKRQLQFFKSSVWPDQDSNPAYQQLWCALYSLTGLNHLPKQMSQINACSCDIFLNRVFRSWKCILLLVPCFTWIEKTENWSVENSQILNIKASKKNNGFVNCLNLFFSIIDRIF